MILWQSLRVVFLLGLMSVCLRASQHANLQSTGLSSSGQAALAQLKQTLLKEHAAKPRQGLSSSGQAALAQLKQTLLKEHAAKPRQDKLTQLLQTDKVNVCVCPNGTPYAPGSCPVDGGTFCTSCDPGYNMLAGHTDCSAPSYEDFLERSSLASSAWLVYHFASWMANSKQQVSRLVDISWTPSFSTPSNDNRQTLFGTYGNLKNGRRRALELYEDSWRRREISGVIEDIASTIAFADFPRALEPRDALNVRQLHLAPAGVGACDYGKKVGASECEAAVASLAAAAGLSPGRPLQIGSGGTCGDDSWGDVPLGCSAQTGLLRAGKTCWESCGHKSGPCEWCGSGKCCRKSWNSDENGCLASEGGSDQHVCVADAGGNWTAYYKKEGPNCGSNAYQPVCSAFDGKAETATTWGGLELVQFGQDVCYIILNTSHQWINETFYLSFVTDADIDSHQTVWSEKPLLIAISAGYLQATVFPAAHSESSELLFFAQYPIKAKNFYAVSLALKEDEGDLAVNGNMVTFVFPVFNSSLNIKNGLAQSGPSRFEPHTPAITVGCEQARSTQRFGGPGGTRMASFSCKNNATIQTMNVSFSAPPGNSLRAMQVTCTDGTKSGWLGNVSLLDKETQAALTAIDEVTSLTAQYGLLVNRIGLRNPPSEVNLTQVVGADPPAQNTLQSGNLNCRGAPIVGVQLAFGEHIDSIALKCEQGAYFKGALLNALRWREYLNTSQLFSVAKALGGVVWNFESSGQLGRWVGRTNIAKGDLLNASSLYTPDELLLPQKGILLLQSPPFYFKSLSVPVLPPPAFGIRWRTDGSHEGTLPPALPPNTTAAHILHAHVEFVGVGLRLVSNDTYIFSTAAPASKLWPNYSDIRLDDPNLLAVLKKDTTSPFTLDFIATVPNVALHVRAITANSDFFDFINYWDDSNWTSCKAACGKDGVQTMQAPQCRYGGTGEALPPNACQPGLSTAQTRACRVADCASVPDCVQLNGTCWYLGKIRESCLNLCAREGMVYDDFHTIHVVGSGASSAVDCQNVLNQLLNASAVRWQDWDIPKEFYDQLDFKRLQTFVVPYYVKNFVPYPDDVAATYGVGCIISNNTAIFGHNHPYRDTSPTLGYSWAYNVQRVCACQPSNFHWAERAFTPCNQTCQKGHRNGNYECLEITGQRADSANCPNATNNTPSPIPCSSNGCVWITQPYGKCELPGLAVRTVQCADPTTGRIQQDEDCDPTLEPATADVCDFNECFTQTDNCDPSATCTNTDGSFTCSCNKGFDGNGTVCDDINECELGTNDCSAFANCTNTIGSYTCQCFSLYSGDGVTCVPRTLTVSVSPLPPTSSPPRDAMGNLLVPEGNALKVTVNMSEINKENDTLIDIVAFVRIPRVSPNPAQNFTLTFSTSGDMTLPTAFLIPANAFNITFQLVSPNMTQLEPLCIYLVEIIVSNPIFFPGSGFVSLQDSFACTVFNVSVLNYTINPKQVLGDFASNSLALETLVAWQRNSNDTKTVRYQVTRRRCLFPTEITPQPKNISSPNRFLFTAAVPAPTTSQYVFTGSYLLTLFQPQTVMIEAAVPNTAQAYPILVSIRLMFPTTAPNLRQSPMCLTASSFTDKCLWQTDRAFTEYKVGDWTQLTTEFQASDIDFSTGHPTVAFVLGLNTGAPKLQVYLAGFQVVSHCHSDISQDIMPTQITYGDALMKVDVAGALVQAHYAFAVLSFNRALQPGHLSLFSYPRPTECVIGNHCPLSGRCVAGEPLTDSTLLPDEYGCAVPQCTDGMRNGNETSTDCGDLNSLISNYTPGCPSCTGNFDRCQSHKDCSGKLCLRERSPLPTLPCFAQLLVGGATTTYRLGTSSVVSSDVSKALWLVRGDPNCELIVYSPSAQANTSWVQGNYTAGDSYSVYGGTFRSFPIDVKMVFVRLYICSNYTDRNACNADSANSCQFCNATSKCYHNVAGQTPCPGDPWAYPLSQDSQEYFLGYNLQQGDEDLGYCAGSYKRRVEVLLPSKAQGCPDSCDVNTDSSCGTGLTQSECESRGCCYATGQCFFSSTKTPAVSLVCQCEQEALIINKFSPLYPIPKGALEAPTQQFLLSFQDLDDNTVTATHRIFLYGSNSTASHLTIAAQLDISTQDGKRLITLTRPGDPWHLAPPGASACDFGVPVGESECEAAVASLAAAAGRTPGPSKYSQCRFCSVQTGGDWTAYLGKGMTSDCPHNFQLVCTVRPLHFANPTSMVCDYGEQVVGASECQAAVASLAAAAGRSPGRPIQIGSGDGHDCGDDSWGSIPLGCSAFTEGDWTAYYKTNGTGCPVYGYQIVCIVRPLHLAPAGVGCDYGKQVGVSECEAAVASLAAAAGLSPGRHLQIGSGGTCGDDSRGDVPLGCSAQTGLLRSGKTCWESCGHKSGPCEWCGSGKCCRKGWKGGENGCLASEGGSDQHECVAGGNWTAYYKKEGTDCSNIAYQPVCIVEGLYSPAAFDIIDSQTEVVVTVQDGTLYISKHTDLIGALTAQIDGLILFARISSGDVTWWQFHFCLAVLICENDGVCKATISAAVNLANQDDVILVSQGISSSEVIIQRAGLTILGGWDRDFYARFTTAASTSDNAPALLANTFACSFESANSSVNALVSPTPLPAANAYPITVETFSYETLLKDGKACGDARSDAGDIPAFSRVLNTFVVEFRLRKSALLGWELLLPKKKKTVENIFDLKQIVLTDPVADTSIITNAGTRLYVNCVPARRYRIEFSFFSPVRFQSAMADDPRVNVRVFSGRTAAVLNLGWQLFDASEFFTKIVDPFNSDLVIADTYSEFERGVTVYRIDNKQVTFSGVNTGQLTVLTGGNIRFTEFQLGNIQINDAYPALGNGVVTGRVVANYTGMVQSKVNIIGYMYILDMDTHECFIIYRNTVTSPVKESADCTTAFGREDQYTFLSPGFEPMPTAMQGSVLLEYRSVTMAWTPPILADVTEFRLHRGGKGLIAQRGATFQDQDPLTFEPGVPVLYCVDAYFNLQQMETAVVYSIIYSSRQVCVLTNFPWHAIITGTVQRAPQPGESIGASIAYIRNSLVCAVPKSAQLILAGDNLVLCYEEAIRSVTAASRACCTYSNALGQYTINARHTQLKGVQNGIMNNILNMVTIAEDDVGALTESFDSAGVTVRYAQRMEASLSTGSSVSQVGNITTSAITVNGYVLYPDTCALTDFTVTVVLKSGAESVTGTTFSDGSYTISWNLGSSTDAVKLVFTSSNLINLKNKDQSKVGTVHDNMVDVSALAAGTYQLDLTDTTMIKDYLTGETVTGLVKATECIPGANIGVWDVDIYSCGGLYTTVSVGFFAVDLSPPRYLLSPHNYTYTFVARSYRTVPANISLGYMQAAQVFFQEAKKTLEIFPLLKAYSNTQLPENALLQSFVYSVQPTVRSQTAVGTCGSLLPAGFKPTSCREPGVVYKSSSLCLQDGPRPGLDIISQSQLLGGTNPTLCQYTLLLEAFEDHQPYGGPSTRCDLVWATVGIHDYVSTPDPSTFITRSTLMNHGEAQYNFTAQGPSLVCPLTRHIQFNLLYEQKPPTASAGNTSSRGARTGLVDQGIQLMIVNGSKQRAPLFIAESDGHMPWLILRDPPGDMSFCKWSTADDLNFVLAMSADKGTSYKGLAKIAVNVELSFAVGWWPFYTSTNDGVLINKDTLALTYSSDASVSHSSTFSVSTKLDRSFATNKGPGMPPPLGDLMVGGAVAFQYTLVDNVFVDIAKCSVARTITGAWDNPVANQNAMYIYTHWEILNILRRLSGLIADGDLVNAEKSYGQTTAQLQAAYDSWVDVLRYKWQLSKQLTAESPRMFTKLTQDVLNAMTSTMNSDWTGVKGDPTNIDMNFAFLGILHLENIAAGWSSAYSATILLLAATFNFPGSVADWYSSASQLSMAKESWDMANTDKQLQFIQNFKDELNEVVANDWTKEATLWDSPGTPAFWHWRPYSARKKFQHRDIGENVYRVLEPDLNNLPVKWAGKVNPAAGKSTLSRRSYVWSGGDSGTDFVMSMGSVSAADTASKVGSSFGMDWGVEPAPPGPPAANAVAKEVNNQGSSLLEENRRRAASVEIAGSAQDLLANQLWYRTKTAQAQVHDSDSRSRRQMTGQSQAGPVKFSSGFGMTMAVSASQRQAETQSKSQSIAIHLEDKDKNDRFWMEIYEDPVYRTPIFKVQASDTQCPCEAMTDKYIGAFAAVPDAVGGSCKLGAPAAPCIGSDCCAGKELTEIAWNNQLTTCIQEFELSVQGESTLLNLAPDADAVFTLVATSTPPTQRIQETYTLTLASGGYTADQAHLNGLEPRWNGLPVRQYVIQLMNLNQPHLVELRLSRLDRTQYEFGFSPGFPIAASMFPDCDDYFRRKTVLLQAQWQRTAPYIHLSTALPVLTWTPATKSLTLLAFGFEFPSDSLSPDGSWFLPSTDYVILQYRLLGSLQWWDLNLFNQANNLLTYNFGPAPFYEVGVVYELGADVKDPQAAHCLSKAKLKCLNEGTYELRVLSSLAKFAPNEQHPDPYLQLQVTTRYLSLLQPSSPANNQNGVSVPASKIILITYTFNMNLACGNFRIDPTVKLNTNPPVILPSESLPPGIDRTNPDFKCMSDGVLLVSIDLNPLSQKNITGVKVKVTYKDLVWAEDMISTYQLPALAFTLA